MSFEPIYTPAWWASFFSWDPGVQLEFVHEALETSLGLPKRWGDKTWGDICEAQEEQGRHHMIPQPFDVRHLMVMYSGNIFGQPNQWGLISMDDSLGRYDTFYFTIEGVSPECWKSMLELAETRIVTEFSWVKGWRENCIKLGKAGPEPLPENRPKPERFGPN
jgi:hypothetical protein